MLRENLLGHNILNLLGLILVFASLFCTQRVWANDNAKVAKLRCGWYENPTPGNIWFTDKDGEWTLSVQGGHQAEGNLPKFGAKRWVRTNGNYGYGCACIKIIEDKEKHLVVRLLSGAARPLKTCRNDPTLTEPKSN
jgi:hypothetical protein